MAHDSVDFLFAATNTNVSLLSSLDVTDVGDAGSKMLLLVSLVEVRHFLRPGETTGTLTGGF